MNLFGSTETIFMKHSILFGGHFGFEQPRARFAPFGITIFINPTSRGLMHESTITYQRFGAKTVVGVEE